MRSYLVIDTTDEPGSEGIAMIMIVGCDAFQIFQCFLEKKKENSEKKSLQEKNPWC